MMKRVNSKNAPAPKGPYSHAVISQGLIFVSGQAAADPITGEFKLGDIRTETEITLLNIKMILESAGTDLEHVVKCSVFLKDISDFDSMNEVYERFFTSVRPARTTVQAQLAFNIKVEIDAIAELPGNE